jgi:hypothetical protein
MPRILLLLFLAGALSARADDFLHLRDAESPDHQYRCQLYNAGGKLRFQVFEIASQKMLGEVASAYEPLLKTNDRAADLAQKTKVEWSPDGRYVALREPDNSETQSSIVLVSVGPKQAKQVPLSMAKLKELSPREHTDWSVEFDDWVGKRMFVVRLFGSTYHQDSANEHDEMALAVKIQKDDSVTVVNADE